LNVNGGRIIQFVFLAGIVAVCAAPQALAQGTMVRPMPESATRDSSGNLKKNESSSITDAMARGLVVLPDGSAPEELVEIYGGCGGVQRFVAVADSKGRVSFNLNVLGDTSKAQGCAWHASLDGYRSETKAVTDIKPKSGVKLGTIVLQPLSSGVASLTSSADGQANNAQRDAREGS
jgi:hypothetical protein